LLGHAYLVTTDIIGSFGFVVAVDTFVAYLKSPRLKNILLLSVGMSFALMSKFSAIILPPIFLIFWIVYIAYRYREKTLNSI
jgi:hypothetical protein